MNHLQQLNHDRSQFAKSLVKYVNQVHGSFIYKTNSRDIDWETTLRNTNPMSDLHYELKQLQDLDYSIKNRLQYISHYETLVIQVLSDENVIDFKKMKGPEHKPLLFSQYIFRMKQILNPTMIKQIRSNEIIISHIASQASEKIFQHLGVRPKFDIKVFMQNEHHGVKLTMYICP